MPLRTRFLRDDFIPASAFNKDDKGEGGGDEFEGAKGESWRLEDIPGWIPCNSKVDGLTRQSEKSKSFMKNLNLAKVMVKGRYINMVRKTPFAKDMVFFLPIS